MIQAVFGGEPFSAKVELWLEYGGDVVALSHVEPADVIAREPRDLPAGEAVVAVSVDGTVHRTRVMLDRGMSTAEPRTRIRPLDSVPF